MNKNIYGDRDVIIARIVDGECRKLVKRSKHLMKSLNSWGMDERILEEEFDTVKVLDQEDDIAYIVPKHIWKEHGIRKDFGYGPQVFLPLHFFEVRHRKQPELIP